MRTRFGSFVLDRESRQLREGDVLCPLKPKAFELLDLLITRRPAAVSKREIHDQLWPNTFVSESTLSSLAAQVRRALGTNGAACLRTVHGFGYAFDADATDEAGPRSALVEACVFWNRRAMPLAAGENVIGRDAACPVQVVASGVSRRHALIRAEGGRFVLEDLGSKNGTFLGHTRVESAAELRDGDEFRLGRTPLLFRLIGEPGPTTTES